MRLRVLLCILVLFGATCFAGPINPLDPVMISGAGGGSVHITSTTFTFQIFVDQTQSGTSPVLRNDTGILLTSLTITPPPGAYTTVPGVPNTCIIQNSFFNFCSAPQMNGGSWFFSGPGIPPLGEFTFSVLGFNPSPTANDWIFTAQANLPQIPEPISIALFCPGLVGLGLLMRRRSTV